MHRIGETHSSLEDALSLVFEELDVRTSGVLLTFDESCHQGLDL